MQLQPSRTFAIADTPVGEDAPVYFIADIAANHDGDLNRARDLIARAAEAGAQAAKFQHFSAATIVSDTGFRTLPGKQSHQAGWKKSVYEVYADASLSLDWTPSLVAACQDAGIAFLTTPYSPDLADAMRPTVPAFKIGSGDITWIAYIEHLARQGKPLLIATGASTADDVHRAVSTALRHSSEIALLQCNTNYTADPRNFSCIQLNVLKTFRAMYPGMVLGLSDHTPGHATVLGAVALGAKIVEKHFTDDTTRDGPDHRFSMTPLTWREMVDRTRELESAMGNGVKIIEPNEGETVVLQRRSLRAVRDLPEGHHISAADFIPLRPCPPDAFPLWRHHAIAGRRLLRSVQEGDYLRISDLVVHD